MIDFKDRFDSLQDLSIPEEILGAYIEGNLRGSELREVNNLLSTDDDLSNLVQSIESEEISSDLDAISSWDTLDFAGTSIHNHNNISQIELPPNEQICMPPDQSVNDIICITNSYLADATYIENDNNDYQRDDTHCLQ